MLWWLAGIWLASGFLIPVLWLLHVAREAFLRFASSRRARSAPVTKAAAASELMGRVYIHMDPRPPRRLLYVGMSTALQARPTDFSDREILHRATLYALQEKGFTEEQIVHVVADGLNLGRAARIEEALIAALDPPLNLIGRPEWMLAASGGISDLVMDAYPIVRRLTKAERTH